VSPANTTFPARSPPSRGSCAKKARSASSRRFTARNSGAPETARAGTLEVATIRIQRRASPSPRIRDRRRTRRSRLFDEAHEASRISPVLLIALVALAACGSNPSAEPKPAPTGTISEVVVVLKTRASRCRSIPRGGRITVVTWQITALIGHRGRARARYRIIAGAQGVARAVRGDREGGLTWSSISLSPLTTRTLRARTDPVESSSRLVSLPAAADARLWSAHVPQGRHGGRVRQLCAQRLHSNRQRRVGDAGHALCGDGQGTYTSISMLIAEEAGGGLESGAPGTCSAQREALR